MVQNFITGFASQVAISNILRIYLFSLKFSPLSSESEKHENKFNESSARLILNPSFHTFI